MPMGTSYVGEARKVFFIMFFCCCFVISAQRINMSIAIIEMVNWSHLYKRKPSVCPVSNGTNLQVEDGEYDWSSTKITQVLVSYFYGLVLIQLPSELLVERLSPKFVAFTGILLSSIFTYFTPEITRLHFGAIIVTQMIKAAGHALTVAAFSVMAGQWIPSKRLIYFASASTSGIQVGAFATILLSGIFNNYPAVSWRNVFYITGDIGIVWCVLWLYLCFSFRFTPVLSSSRNITNFPRTDLRIPIREILLSKAFWGYVAAGIATYWMVALNIFLLPLINRVVFGIHLQWNALLSSFPNVLQALLYLLSFGIIRKKARDKTMMRRLFTSIGMSTFATCMVLLTFTECMQYIGLLLLVIAVGAIGFNLATLAIIPVDMSPNFSGILAGIMNTVGALAGSALPIMVGVVLSEESGIKAWNKIFYASAFVAFISMILLMAYTSCEIQPWNDTPEASFLKTASSSRSMLILSKTHVQQSSSRLLEQEAEPRPSKSKISKKKSI